MVDWPADMPDDMLEDAIVVARKALDEHDFESEGVEVIIISSSNNNMSIDCKDSEEAYG